MTTWPTLFGTRDLGPGSRTCKLCLDEALHVFEKDAAVVAGALDLRQVHAELARVFAHRR